MIQVSNLNYKIGDFRLQDISLEILEGEYFVLLGKPGSGKSIFLECICGLNRISAGTIKIAGRDVTYAEPKDRGIGYVPQDYALFSTKSVQENIVFGLRVKDMPRNEIESRLDHIVDILNIGYLLNRSVRGLSGGEKQKVALARALIIRPKVLLLDEPVSALDEATREMVCIELKRIQQETGTTTVHVSHNFEETRIVADRLGILRAGQLAQVGTPDEVFNRPVDADIAIFLRVGNVLKGYAEADGNYTCISMGEIKWVAQGVISESPREVEFVLPAQDIYLSPNEPQNGFENHLTGKIIGILPRGIVAYIAVEISPGLTITAIAHPSLQKAAPGTNVHLSFPASAIHILR